jgi:hypothetical protein
MRATLQLKTKVASSMARAAGHAADHVATLARRLLDADDEAAQLAETVELCEHASSCCSGTWIALLARSPPGCHQSPGHSPATTLLDELLLLVIITQFAPPGMPMCDVFHCPAEHAYPYRRSSAALPSEQIHQYGSPYSTLLHSLVLNCDTLDDLQVACDMHMDS